MTTPAAITQPPPRTIGLGSLLDWLRGHGTMVRLEWQGLDGELWTCVWVQGGQRYSGTGTTQVQACWAVLKAAGVVSD
jgi:hypothetical protein